MSTKGISTPLWTDDEIGYVLDSLNETAQEVASVLGRTTRAVHHKRQQLRDGWQPSRSPWSESEDEFMASVPHFTAEQIAAHLGRSVQAVSTRRPKVSPVGISGHRSSPHAVGRRTLLAKTCPHCGLLLDASWFHRDTRGGHKTQCLRCGPKENTEKVRARNAKRTVTTDDRLQALSLTYATRSGEPYIEADHKILADPDLTGIEKAIQLGRTYRATLTQVSACGYSSKVGRGDPSDAQWIIQLAEGVAA